MDELIIPVQLGGISAECLGIPIGAQPTTRALLSDRGRKRFVEIRVPPGKDLLMPQFMKKRLGRPREALVLCPQKRAAFQQAPVWAGACQMCLVGLTAFGSAV